MGKSKELFRILPPFIHPRCAHLSPARLVRNSLSLSLSLLPQPPPTSAAAKRVAKEQAFNDSLSSVSSNDIPLKLPLLLSLLALFLELEKHSLYVRARMSCTYNYICVVCIRAACARVWSFARTLRISQEANLHTKMMLQASLGRRPLVRPKCLTYAHMSPC